MRNQEHSAGLQLVQQAEQAVRQGNATEALELLGRAETLAPGDVTVHLYKSLAYRAVGDLPAAQRSIERALELDPYSFLARLSHAWLLDQQGLERKAAAAYTRALAIAPADDNVPPDLQAPLRRARDVVAQYKKELRAHLRERTKSLRTQHNAWPLQRFDESVDILSGHAEAHVQQPLMLHYPQLPAVPFFDRELFPWLSKLEEATPTIQGELEQLLEQDGDEDFAPYLAYPPGSPLGQADELNNSRRWSSYFLWRDGVRQDDACARCPRTAELLDSLPMARQRCYAPTAMFSALGPRTGIPPHTGSTNTRATVHLPLLLPGNCYFQVGNFTREWRLGEAWVFDDTIRHQAWNDSDSRRIILIFDVWNPYLSAPERELVTAMMEANAEFHDLDVTGVREHG